MTIADMQAAVGNMVVTTINADSNLADESTFWTEFDVDKPTLLVPYRDNDLIPQEGIGSIRLSFQYGATRITTAGVEQLASAFQTGAIWLSRPGKWHVRAILVLELGVTPPSPTAHTLPMVQIPDPDDFLVRGYMTAELGAAPSYHAEIIPDTNWNQIMSMRQRWRGLGNRITLQTRDNAIRYRWGGEPANPNGTGYDFLAAGDSVVLEQIPLSSLWVRCDTGTNATINMISLEINR